MTRKTVRSVIFEALDDLAALAGAALLVAALWLWAIVLSGATP